MLQIDIKGLPLITAQTFDQSSDQRGSDLQINALSRLFSYLVAFHKATTFTQLSQEILSGHFVSGFFRPTTNLKVLYAQFYLGGVVDGEVDGPVPGDNRQLTLVIFF